MHRREAIEKLTAWELQRLTHEERAEQLSAMTHENWRGASEWDALDADVREELEEGELSAPASDSRYDAVLQMWLNTRYAAVTNHYLHRRLLELELPVDDVTGEPEVLEPCPCCGLRTLGARAIHAICTVCWWEDDGQDNRDADSVAGGPNYELSLTQARVNFIRYGIANPRRTDLRKFQDPASMYEVGRTFVLSEDGALVSESSRRWNSTTFEP